MITASKGSEEVTYDVRLELQRQRGLENARKWLKRAPWLGVGLVSAALICAVIGLGTQFLAGQGSIRSTAEALELDYEEATLTVAAYTSTPTLTATYDPVLDVRLTASSLQTQTAAASQTRAAILVIQQQTRSALATQLALTPTPTPTITSQPTATSIPTTFVDVEAGNFTIWNAVKSGRVAFGMSPCWASEAEATSAVQIDPSLTVDGIAAPLIELPSRTITHSPSGSGWCLEWPSKAYFVVTIEVGIHTVSWQWGNRAGSSTFTVVSR
jgi:hypothetical protein